MALGAGRRESTSCKARMSGSEQDHSQHALQIAKTVRPAAAVDVQGHDPDRATPTVRHGLAPRCRVTST